MGKMIVISGASGVGKGTVLNLMMENRKDLTFSVSATTRDPRPGEIDGVSYYFVSKAKFMDMIVNGEFLEYDDHMDNYYGTPKAQLEEKLAKGHVLLDIEPNGAFIVKHARPDAQLIFVAPPSLEELEKRLRSRGDTSEAQITKRLGRSAWEMEQGKKYDHYVVNDQVEACAEEILNIIANAN